MPLNERAVSIEAQTASLHELPDAKRAGEDGVVRRRADEIGVGARRSDGCRECDIAPALAAPERFAEYRSFRRWRIAHIGLGNERSRMVESRGGKPSQLRERLNIGTLVAGVEEADEAQAGPWIRPHDQLALDALRRGQVDMQRGPELLNVVSRKHLVHRTDHDVRYGNLGTNSEPEE